MKKLKVLLLALALSASLAVPASAAWYDTPYAFCEGAGVISLADRHPDTPIAREAAVRLIYGTVRPSGWDGVNPMEWGVQTGVTDGSYIWRTLTRAEAVTMLWRAYGSYPHVDSGDYFDDAVPAWAVKATKWAGAFGICNGTADRVFSPNAEVTEAQMVAMCYRAVCVNCTKGE